MNNNSSNGAMRVLMGVVVRVVIRSTISMITRKALLVVNQKKTQIKFQGIMGDGGKGRSVLKLFFFCSDRKPMVLAHM